jgi:endonuclease/exonuclease/phosphatase family metal-dependent hydrolase
MVVFKRTGLLGNDLFRLWALGIAVITIVSSCASTEWKASRAWSQAIEDSVVYAQNSEESFDFRLVNYNVGLLRVFGNDLVPRVRERVAAIPAVMNELCETLSPDIIVFQEVWTPSDAKRISKALEPLSYKTWRPAGSSILGLGSGLLFAVRKPWTMDVYSFEPHKVQTGLSAFAPRGNGFGIIRNSEGKPVFVLMGTHLMAADTNNGVAVKAEELRTMLAQMDQALDLVERVTQSRVPLVFAGDFNAGPSYVDEVWQKALSRGLRDSGEGIFNDKQGLTWDQDNLLVVYGNYPHENSARIDHVLLQSSKNASWSVQKAWVGESPEVVVPSLRPGTTRGQTMSVPFSDHHPYVVDLRLSFGLD